MRCLCDVLCLSLTRVLRCERAHKRGRHQVKEPEVEGMPLPAAIDSLREEVIGLTAQVGCQKKYESYLVLFCRSFLAGL